MREVKLRNKARESLVYSDLAKTQIMSDQEFTKDARRICI